MLIRPQVIEKDARILSNNRLGFERLETEFGEVFSKKRVAGNKNGTVRVEELDIYPEGNFMVKKCLYGKRTNRYGNNEVTLKNTMYSTVDCGSGELLQFGSTNLSPYGDWMYAGSHEYPEREKIILSGEENFYESNRLNDCFTSGYDLSSIKSDIYANEDVLQIAYNDCVGLLTSFFSQWNFGIPTDSFVIIDTLRGEFNVPKFTYLNIVDREHGKKMYAYYIKHVSSVVDLLTRNCEMYKKKLRIMVFNSAYTTVIKIKDLENKGLRLDYNLNASDHFSSILHNMVSGNDKWILSEESHVILKPDMGVVSDKMIDSCDCQIASHTDFPF